jgi:hypothetical protein
MSKKRMPVRDNGITDMMRCDAQNGDDTYGIVVGTGNAAEDNSDYKLGTKIAHGLTAGKLSYGPVSHVAPVVNGANVDYVMTRSYYNEAATRSRPTSSASTLKSCLKPIASSVTWRREGKQSPQATP